MESGADNKWHRTCTIVILIKAPRNDITTLTGSQPLHRLTVPNFTIVISKPKKGIPVINPSHPSLLLPPLQFSPSHSLPLPHFTPFHSQSKTTTHLPKFKSHTLFSLCLSDQGWGQGLVRSWLRLPPIRESPRRRRRPRRWRWRTTSSCSTED